MPPTWPAADDQDGSELSTIVFFRDAQQQQQQPGGGGGVAAAVVPERLPELSVHSGAECLAAVGVLAGLAGAISTLFWLLQGAPLM